MTFQRILPRRDTAANWTAANPVLAVGELGLETDTGKIKRGDGVTAWTALAYSLTEVGATTAIDAHLGGDATNLVPRVDHAGRIGNRIAYLGDSITAGSWQNSTNYQATSYPLFANLLSGGRLLTVANAGKSGDTSAGALARFDTEVTPYSPTVVVVLLGTNDTGQGIALATFQANIKAIVAKTRAIGAVPVLGTIPPNNTTARHTPINTWNAWLRRYAASESLPILDFYGTLVDPANGNYLAAYFNDGTHPNAAGYLALGQMVANVLTPSTPPLGPYMSADNVDGVNLLSSTNSVLLNDANSDGVPEGWFAYGGSSGYAHALVTDPQVPGKLMQVTQTANASLRGIQRAATITTGFAAGDQLLFTGVVTSDGGVTCYARVTFNGGGTSAQAANFTAAVTRGVYYQRLTVPAGTTSLQVDFITNAGTGVVAWGRPTLLNLTALGIA